MADSDPSMDVDHEQKDSVKDSHRQEDELKQILSQDLPISPPLKKVPFC
jgi:hypothetical protein